MQIHSPPRVEGRDPRDWRSEDRIRQKRQAATWFAEKANAWDGRDAHVLAYLLNRHAEACHDFERAVGDASHDARQLRELIDMDALPSRTLPDGAAGVDGVWAADAAGRLVVTGGQTLYQDVLLIRFEVCHAGELSRPY